MQISSLGVHLAQHKNWGRPYGKAPALEYAGAIGKRNQASERWLPHVSQQGSTSTTPYAPLWLRGNDSREWKSPGGRVIPELYGQVRTAWGKPRPSRKLFGRPLVPDNSGDGWLAVATRQRVRGRQPSSQASHRGMAKRLASCQVLHLHHKLRVAPLSSVVREPCEFWLTTSLASSD